MKVHSDLMRMLDPSMGYFSKERFFALIDRDLLISSLPIHCNMYDAQEVIRRSYENV